MSLSNPVGRFGHGGQLELLWTHDAWIDAAARMESSMAVMHQHMLRLIGEQP